MAEGGGGGRSRDLLRNFTIGNAVGKGKFSVVYKAERKDNRALRALKRVNLDVMDEGGAEACLQVKKKKRKKRNMLHFAR